RLDPALTLWTSAASAGEAAAASPRRPSEATGEQAGGGRGGGGKQGMGETLAGAWNCGAAARGAGRAATEGGLGVEPFGAAVMEREGGSGPRAPSGASDGAGPAHARGPPGPR
ncbi:unnamed protein product, partial [Prorocentrum cordatum]